MQRQDFTAALAARCAASAFEAATGLDALNEVAINIQTCDGINRYAHRLHDIVRRRESSLCFIGCEITHSISHPFSAF